MNEAVSFFKNLFNEEFNNRPTLENLSFSTLSQEQASSLITPFSEEEIDNAVSSCASDKAPGTGRF